MRERDARLFDELAKKVAALDVIVKEAAARDDRALGAVASGERHRLMGKLQGEWDELVAMVSRQHEHQSEMARRSQELSSLSAFLQTHYEREKASLARELHDQLGGILTPARMDLSWLQARLGDDPVYGVRMARLSALIDQGIDLKRRIIENLRPSLLDHLGFAAAVQWYVDEACGAAKIKCRVTIAKLERLPSDLEIALYRVVQECVTNVIRHAKAKNVDLLVERNEKGLRVAVCDDGIGMADLDSARNQSHGLVAMTQRMRAINGTLDIVSRVGGGTRVEAFLPIAATV